MFGAEAGVGAQEVYEAAQHQAGADQEQAGETDFANHQGAAQPQMPAVGAGAAAAGAQAILHVGAGGLQRGCEAEEDAGG
jgi:hypothetical protein